ncbi:MoaD/ThiS family protein [Sulfurisphaera ohwakuensis]|uniref:Ubiquitin n=1 Tax=Sulfurisphaera ohwakuensis TaxID=69656 RepID=A0A650CDL9_SULOH|nr:MoaD/ThiS family protein [Sulfurisphaera ohwakuensis]MBB5253129.1 hypothetical protein [Sulfurisphaera ohwakuensis]QGR15953.1 ubiquitin [Sulfurisphaera ohwakuensis]
MVNIIFKGPLVNYFGTDRIILKNSYNNIIDLIKEIDKNDIISHDGKIRAGYIILINGRDYRIYNKQLGENDTVEIIPINHGG